MLSGIELITQKFETHRLPWNDKRNFVAVVVMVFKFTGLFILIIEFVKGYFSCFKEVSVF